MLPRSIVWSRRLTGLLLLLSVLVVAAALLIGFGWYSSQPIVVGTLSSSTSTTGSGASSVAGYATAAGEPRSAAAATASEESDAPPRTFLYETFADKTIASVPSGERRRFTDATGTVRPESTSFWVGCEGQSFTTAFEVPPGCSIQKLCNRHTQLKHNIKC